MEFLPVLLGGDANVYGMARSFYEGYGVTSAAICRRALPAVRRSRLVRVAVQQPGLEQDAIFVHTLRAFAMRHTETPLLLVPCADGYAFLLARHAAELEEYYRFASPPPQTVTQLGTKPGFAAACAAHGLNTPQTVRLPAGEEAPRALPFAYPVIVKPEDSPAYWNCSFEGRRKIFLAGNAGELAGYLRAVSTSSYRGAMLVQEYIPGGDTALRVANAYCDATGAIRLFAAATPLLEERTPEGGGNYAALLAGQPYLDAALRQSLCALLQAAGWHGFANFDIKYHAATGEAYLFEMNPRQGRSAYYATAAGQNLAAPLAGELLGLPPPPQNPRPVLWRIAPWGVVRRCTEDSTLLAEAAALRAAGQCATQLLSPAEGLPRRAWYAASQLNYYRKMARYTP